MLPSSANSKVHFFSGVCVCVCERERKREREWERGREVRNMDHVFYFLLSLFVLLVLFQNSKLFQFVSFLLFY